MPILTRVKKAWNAFRSYEQNPQQIDYSVGPSSNFRPDRPRLRFFNERTIIASIYNRISIDVAEIAIRHIKLDEFGRYLEDVNSLLNRCFTFEANLDQSPRAFRQDIVQTLFDKGVAAIVPVDTVDDPTIFFDNDPAKNKVIDIETMRVGDIITWYPKHICVNLYNENTGIRQEIVLEKRYVAIVENPLYAVMNEPNSTLQRLLRKLALLDTVDEQSSSGKLDIIIQLPYIIKSEARRDQAEKRRQDIEFQLKGSQYGIAYTDGTEKITQLNRPAENNLFKQVEYLTNMLYAQLGITDEVMNGTADEKTMLNYFNRTIKPIVDAIIESMQRAFLGVAGTVKQERIRYFRDPFSLVPVSALAEIADKFTRNEILTSNELRGYMGISPSKEAKADQLVNSNMPQPAAGPTFEDMDNVVNQVFDGLSSDLDKLIKVPNNSSNGNGNGNG